MMLLFPQFHLLPLAQVTVLIRLVMSFQSQSIGVNQPLLQVRQNLNWKQVLPINMLPTVQVQEVHRLFQLHHTANDTTSDLDYHSTTALKLNGGTIKDAGGNNAVLTLPIPGIGIRC